MTHGSYVTGTTPSSTSRYNSAKEWNGSDGRQITSRVTRRLNWNSYTMRHKIGIAPGGLNCHPWQPLTGYDGYGDVEESLATVYPALGGFYTNPFSSNWTTKDEFALLAKLIRKVKDHSFNVGVSLAEVDKLAGGVVSTVKQLGFGAYDLAHGRFESFARRFGTYPPSLKVTRKLALKDVSGRFLEMRYAWQPAIQDAFEAAKAFEALSNGPRQVVTKASHRKVSSELLSLNWGEIPRQQIIQRTYTYEAYEELSAWRQMGLGNPASILWERLPWSFVIDWFIPIGDYLELIGQVPFLKGRFLRSDFAKHTVSGLVQDRANMTIAFKRRPPPIYCSFAWLDRTLPPSLSVPAPTLKVEGAVQGKRVQNAIALAHQVFIGAASFVFGKQKLGKNFRLTSQASGLEQDLLSRLARI